MNMTGQAYAAASARRRDAEASGRQPPVSASQAPAGGCVRARDGRRVGLAELVPAVHLRDAVALHDFHAAQPPRDRRRREGPAAPARPAAVRHLGRRPDAIALARSRPRVALAIAVVMGLAPLTQTLEPLLATPTTPSKASDRCASGPPATPPLRWCWCCARSSPPPPLAPAHSHCRGSVRPGRRVGF